MLFAFSCVAGTQNVVDYENGDSGIDADSIVWLTIEEAIMRSRVKTDAQSMTLSQALLDLEWYKRQRYPQVRLEIGSQREPLLAITVDIYDGGRARKQVAAAELQLQAAYLGDLVSQRNRTLDLYKAAVAEVIYSRIESLISYVLDSASAKLTGNPGSQQILDRLYETYVPLREQIRLQLYLTRYDLAYRLGYGENTLVRILDNDILPSDAFAMAELDINTFINDYRTFVTNSPEVQIQRLTAEAADIVSHSDMRNRSRLYATYRLQPSASGIEHKLTLNLDIAFNALNDWLRTSFQSTHGVLNSQSDHIAGSIELNQVYKPSLAISRDINDHDIWMTVLGLYARLRSAYLQLVPSLDVLTRYQSMDSIWLDPYAIEQTMRALIQAQYDVMSFAQIAAELRTRLGLELVL